MRDCEGWQWIAVMLGIWRSGGIFLPQTASESAQHAPRPCLTVHCSAPGGPAVVGRAEAGATRLTDGTAYLLPTSGSTGRSKWIQGTLHGLDHFVAWEIQELQAGQGDICAQLTAPTFDPVLREVLVPLVAGARLAVPPDRSGLVRSSAAVDWLARTGVTLVHAVPTLARLWCSGNSRTELPSLRALLLAGEPLYEGDLHAWADRFGTGATLYNLYGPSETTLAKCAQRIDLTLIKEVVSEGKVAVGPPLPECEVLVADGDRRCDPYEVGEVLIRTPHASNGYWNMPDLNGERFVRNPFAEEDPLRIFRTRDLGYQLPDGRLVVEGRIDGEYKFRGIRVDLGLIEDAIRRVPGVRDAGVKVATPPAGPAVLAAYVVTDRPVQDIAHELPTDLEGPRPGAWKAVAELPRTHSGKLQRNALPALVVGEGTTDDTADQDPSVRTLLGIWREVMPLAPGLGPHSSFTDAGGQSIEAVQALTRIEDEFGTTLELRDILDLQTPYRIAARIGGQGVPHRSRTRLGSVPASSAPSCSPAHRSGSGSGSDATANPCGSSSCGRRDSPGRWTPHVWQRPPTPYCAAPTASGWPSPAPAPRYASPRSRRTRQSRWYVPRRTPIRASGAGPTPNGSPYSPLPSAPNPSCAYASTLSGPTRQHWCSSTTSWPPTVGRRSSICGRSPRPTRAKSRARHCSSRPTQPGRQSSDPSGRTDPVTGTTACSS